MAISEVAVKNATLMAIDEDQQSRRRARAAVGAGGAGWRVGLADLRREGQATDSEREGRGHFRLLDLRSRKAVLPVVEQLNGLLYYPVQYEGLEASKNIFYIAAPPNQQIIPAVTYLLQKGMKNMYLLGSDYVFPRTANKVIKAQLAAEGGMTVAEDYTPLGNTDYSAVVSEDQGGQAGRGVQHAERRQQRGVLQATESGGHECRQPAGDVGVRGRSGGCGHWRRQLQGPTDGVELLSVGQS